MKAFQLAVVIMALVLGGSVAVMAQDGPPGGFGSGGFGGGSTAVVYDPAGDRFLMGGLGTGGIQAIDMDGNTTPLIEDEALQLTSGLYLNSSTNTLYVLNMSGDFSGLGNDPGAGQFNGTPPANNERPDAPTGGFQQFTDALSIGVLAYDLNSLGQTLNVDLTAVAPDGPRSVTGITQDANGNLYITDSLSGSLYLVDTSGSPFFMQNELFAADEITGITGLVYHPDNFLLTVNASSGELLRIPVDDPTNVSVVTLDQDLSGASQILLNTDGELVVLVNGAEPTIYTLSSADSWATATVDNIMPVQNTLRGLVLADELYQVTFEPPADGGFPSLSISPLETNS